MEDGDPTTDRDDDVLRVIVADDDPFARRAIKQALSQPGIIVIAEAHDGREAVELCLHYRPDIVLMDVVMPVLDGIAATRRIIKELPEQIVVILTSSDEQEFGFLGLRAGAAGFLSKDVDIDALPAGDARGEHGRGGHLPPARHAADRASPARARRRHRHAAGQEPADAARVGDHRPAGRVQDHRRDRRPARALDARPCARTSRTSCASSTCARARRPSRSPRRCAAGSRARRPRR